MTKSTPVPEYTDWLAASIARYEALARSVISHKPEKGRIVEGVVKSALRAILPGRFSIGTGFAITASGRTSPQLDLVIYDAFLNAPIILEGGTGLFPIECVYGFVEVKSVLNRDDIHSAVEAISTVRSFAEEKKYVSYQSLQVSEGKLVAAEIQTPAPLPPRSFIFSVRSDYGSLQSIETELTTAVEAKKAHVHGLMVLEKEWFLHQVAHETPPRFFRMEGRALAHFCAMVLYNVQSMEIRPASMRPYLKLG